MSQKISIEIAADGKIISSGNVDLHKDNVIQHFHAESITINVYNYQPEPMNNHGQGKDDWLKKLKNTITEKFTGTHYTAFSRNRTLLCENRILPPLDDSGCQLDDDLTRYVEDVASLYTGKNGMLRAIERAFANKTTTFTLILEHPRVALMCKAYAIEDHTDVQGIVIVVLNANCANKQIDEFNQHLEDLIELEDGRQFMAAGRSRF